jgi:hypothetical protein
MTQAQLDRAVAQATGESLRTIHDLGFSSWGNHFEERKPLVVNWDALDARRYSFFPQRRRQAVGT